MLVKFSSGSAMSPLEISMLMSTGLSSMLGIGAIGAGEIVGSGLMLAISGIGAGMEGGASSLITRSVSFMSGSPIPISGNGATGFVALVSVMG